MSADDILELARQVLAGKSRSYVTDAAKISKAYVDLVTLHASYCISPETYLALEARLRVAEKALTKAEQLAAGELGNGCVMTEIHEAVTDALVAIQEEANPPPVANYKQTLVNLKETQERCNERLEAERELRKENARLKEALMKLATSPGQISRVCGFEKERGEFCNLPAPRWFYQYANGKEVDLCAQHARGMKGSRERE